VFWRDKAFFSYVLLLLSSPSYSGYLCLVISICVALIDLIQDPPFMPEPSVEASHLNQMFFHQIMFHKCMSSAFISRGYFTLINVAKIIVSVCDRLDTLTRTIPIKRVFPSYEIFLFLNGLVSSFPAISNNDRSSGRLLFCDLLFFLCLFAVYLLIFCAIKLYTANVLDLLFFCLARNFTYLWIHVNTYGAVNVWLAKLRCLQIKCMTTKLC